MARAAGGFRDLPVVRGDLQGLGEATRGERQGVPESVRRLGCILGDNARRRVTVIAHGNRTVARLGPAVVMFSHDVAVRARRRIVGQIRGPLRIYEGIDPDSHSETDRRADGEHFDPAKGHVPTRGITPDFDFPYGSNSCEVRTPEMIS